MKKVARDALIVLVSVALAIWLSRTGFFAYLLKVSGGNIFIDSFISGLFFTSLFTTPLSIAAFSTLATTANLLQMSFFGALGAVVGDLVLFLFVKNALAEDISHIINSGPYSKYFLIFKKRIFTWITPFIGALVIASPLPDELGIAMMGLSRLSVLLLIPISFVMNFIGILAIGLIAGAL